ncbi:MAG TPA: Gldg family protein [Polyangiaceae bacterium]|nr:Gldg family protein [Polyangiaceae bacterium]
MATEQQRKKAAAQTGFYLVVIAAIAVLANILSAGVYKRFDETKTDRFTLSQGSGRLIRSLKGPIQVDAYVTHGLAQMDAFIRDLTDLLKEYERAGGGKFKYTIIEPKTDELKEKAKDAGLEEMAFGEQSATGGDQASISQGYMGLVLKYGSEKGVIPQLNPGAAQGLEFWITNKIREIRDKADNIKHKVGVVTGKDELKLSDQNLVPKQGQQGASIQAILSRAFPFYELVDVDLKGGDTEIDKGLDGLIITQPQKAYTDKELRRVDQFLMLGNKSLAVFASAVSMKPNDPSMSATLDLHNLDKLIAGYGINMKKDAVLDFGSQFRIGVITQGGIAPIRHPGIAHVVDDRSFDDNNTRLLDTSFAGFFRMEEILFPFPSTLEILRDKQPSDVKISVVARTTPAASALTDGTVDMKMRMNWPPKPPYDQRAIAAVAEGKLKSAFAGSPDDAIKVPERAPAPSRVLVVSSSEFLTNPFAYSGNGPDLGQQFAMFGGAGGDRELLMIAGQYANRYLTNTILSVKNTLDWISGDADLLAASAKLLQEPNLTYRDVAKPKIKAEDDEASIRKKDEDYKAARGKLQTGVQWTLTMGVPLFFAFFGMFRWRNRQTKKDQYRI